MKITIMILAITIASLGAARADPITNNCALTYDPNGQLYQSSCDKDNGASRTPPAENSKTASPS